MPTPPSGSEARTDLDRASFASPGRARLSPSAQEPPQLVHPMSKRGTLMRRLMHCALAGILVYYLFPAYMLGIPTWVFLVLLFILLPAAIEVIRLRTGKTFFFLRDLERDRVASYLWFTTGATVLIVLFPQYIAMPCILATSCGDPVLGETRRFRRRYILLAGFLVCSSFFWLYGYPLVTGALAGLVVFAAEGLEIEIDWKFRDDLFWSRSKQRFSRWRTRFALLLKSDDDFVMQIASAIILFLLVLVLRMYHIDFLMPPAAPLVTPYPDLYQYSWH